MIYFRKLFLLILFTGVLCGCSTTSTCPPTNCPANSCPTPQANLGSVSGQTIPAGTISEQQLYNNSIIVTCNNPQKLWEAIVSSVQKYFPIQHEDPCRQIGGIINGGYLSTGRVCGATIFEPWKKDSVGFDQRWESTLQSISRQARVRVIPQDSVSGVKNQFMIDIIVNKEIENVKHPLGSQISSGNSFLSDSRETFRDPILVPSDDGQWINRGRDPLLEQRILADIVDSIQQNCR